MGRLDRMKGGGFLNNVDGTITGYTLQDHFPDAAPDPESPQLFMVLNVRQDGADADVQTTLRGGSLQFLEIASDGRSVSNLEGNAARIWDKSDLYNFLRTADKAGLADGGIVDTDPNVLDFSGLVGARFRFVQTKDEERMAAREKSGKGRKRVDKKTGKEYDLTRLEVEKYYGRATNGAAKSVGSGSTPAAQAARAAGKGTSATSPDLTDEAAPLLRAILAENGGSVHRSDLTRLITKREMRNPNREALRKLIFSEDFLGTEQGWVFDRSSKEQAIVLVPSDSVTA